MTGARRMLRVFSWPCLKNEFEVHEKKDEKLIFFLLLQLLFCCRQQTNEQLWNRVQVSELQFKGWSFLQMEFRTKILRSPKWWVEVTIKQPTTAGTKSEEKERFTVMFSVYPIHLESFSAFFSLFSCLVFESKKISIMKLKFASRKQRPQSAFKCHSRHSTEIDSFVLVSGCF